MGVGRLGVPRHEALALADGRGAHPASDQRLRQEQLEDLALPAPPLRRAVVALGHRACHSAWLGLGLELGLGLGSARVALLQRPPTRCGVCGAARSVERA